MVSRINSLNRAILHYKDCQDISNYDRPVLTLLRFEFDNVRLKKAESEHHDQQQTKTIYPQTCE